MLKFEKKFSPKNSLLQYNLEQFLDWRFTQSKNSEKPRFIFLNSGSFGKVQHENKKNVKSENFKKKKSKFYKPKNKNMQKITSNTFSSGEHFFPEKKSFMQFWTLPLLGASFLSFLAVEKPNVLSQESGQTSLLNFRNGTWAPLNSKVVEKTLTSTSTTMNKETLFLNNLLQGVQDSSAFLEGENFAFYRTDYPVKTSRYTSEAVASSFFKKTEKSQIENLCSFYLNLTEQKLLGSSNYKEFSLNFSNNAIEALLLKFLYFQNSLFHWTFYPLYNPGFVSSSSRHLPVRNLPTEANMPIFLQKFNAETSFVSFETFNKNVSLDWKKNPSLSYLKSTQFFESWVKNLKFKNLNTTNPKDFNLSDFTDKKFPFPNFGSLQDKSVTLEYFEKFLQTLNVQKRDCVSAYENLKTKTEWPQLYKVQNHSTKNFHKLFFETFENKYKSSVLQFYFKSKLSPSFSFSNRNFERFQNNTFSKRSGLKNEKFKNILTQSLFTNFQKKGIDSSQLLFSDKLVEMSDWLNDPVIKKSVNLEGRLKKFLYQLFLLQELKNESTVFQTAPQMNQDAEKLGLHFFGLNKEVADFEKNLWKKNPEKFIQEMNLYIQFQHICKVLMEQTQKGNNNSNLYDSEPTRNKSMLYFSKKSVPNSEPHFENFARESFFEMNPEQTSAKRTFVFSETSKFFKPQNSFYDNPRLLTTVSTIMGNETIEKKYETTSKWLKNRFSALSEVYARLNGVKRMGDVQSESVAIHAGNDSSVDLTSRFASLLSLLKKQEKQALGARLNQDPKFHSPEFFQINMRQFYLDSDSERSQVQKITTGFSSDIKLLKTQKKHFLTSGFSKPVSRKTEKIFRTYLSIKNAKGLQNKSPGYFFSKTAFTREGGFPRFSRFATGAGLAALDSQATQERPAELVSSQIMDKNNQKHKNNVFSVLQNLKKRARTSRYASEATASSAASSRKESFNFSRISQKKVFGQNLKRKKRVQQKKDFTDFPNSQKENVLHDNSFLQKFNMFTFLKKADFLYTLSAEGEPKTKGESRIFEKKKAAGKKRRFKKLKLENRRRKKRKRFYPRPHFLRFQLYSSFLKKRHLRSMLFKQDHWEGRFSAYGGESKNKNSLGTLTSSISNSSSNFSKISSVFKPSYQNLGKLKYSQLSGNIYGQKITILENNAWSSQNANLRQKEFYKISNETLTEFERLCWKSYWLRTNLKPYVYKIQKSLKRMKNLENTKTNNEIFTGFLQSFSTQNSVLSKKVSDSGFSNFSLLGNQQTNVVQTKKSEKYRFLTATPVYLNIRENLNPVFQNAFSNKTLFQQIARRAEYERLLYERLNDEIKNVKSQLTVDGQNQARSYKTGRQKIEKSPLQPFWNTPYAFQNNYLQPNLLAAMGFKNTDFTRTDFANKAFPTLRLLWVCNKTQLFTYQPNNLAQNLWSTYKKREQTKNNQTRKFFYRFSRKVNDFKDFMEIQANTYTQPETGGLSLPSRFAVASVEKREAPPSLASLASKKKQKRGMNHDSEMVNFENQDQRLLSGSENSEDRPLELVAQSESEIFKNKLKNKKLQNLSVSKTRWVDKKIQTFGGVLIEKNYGPYLRKLKFRLQQNPISKQEVLSLYNKENASISNLLRSKDQGTAARSSGFSLIFKNEKEKDKSNGPWFETNMENSVQKRQFHFWWSLQTQQTNLPFLLGSPFLFSNLDNTFLYNAYSSTHQSSPFQTQFILQVFWLCSSVCHLAIFFALIRIPEIRSLVKFQILILSKFSSAYFMGLFAIYDLFKKYQKKIQILGNRAVYAYSAKSDSRFASSLFLAKQDKRENRYAYEASEVNRQNFFKISETSGMLNFNFVGFKSQTSQNKQRSRNLSDKEKNGPFLNETSQKSLNFAHSRTWVHSTLHWSFSYRLFFKPLSILEGLSPLSIRAKLPVKNNQSENSKEISSAVLKKKSALLSQAFNLLTLTGMSPIYGTSPSQMTFYKKKMVKNRESNSFNNLKTYNSSSTGFFWQIFMKNFEKQLFQSQKQNFLNTLTSKDVVYVKGLRDKSSGSNSVPRISNVEQSNIQIQAFLSLIVLGATRVSFSAFYVCFNIFYKLLFQIIDMLEGTLFIFYKFLEKPAEVMVDWIAEVFLIEWTSDIYSYVPEAFDTATWTSMTKFSRSARFFYGLPFGFLVQRFFLESTQLFYHWVFQSDTDLRVRQKKGVIFWDIWSEILIQAAEKYQMNLSSLSTIKEEQELLMENLLEQKTMEKNSVSLQFSTHEKTKVQLGPFFNKRKKEDFLNQEDFVTSLNQFNPLMKFIQNHPSFYNPAIVQSLKVTKSPSRELLSPRSGSFSLIFKSEKSSKTAEKFLFVNKKGYFKKNPFENLPFSSNSNQFNFFKSDMSFAFETFKQIPLKRWSVSQYLNTQGKDTDLFMDIHPPKSFTHVSFLKSYLPAQEILGSLVCDIYAGLFAEKVSKNVLIVGAPGMAKSFFIQALAGETELKMVLDNAHRYAFVNGGVPIGMKLLREVFDSIALHTPCLFLLEDVHIIGERRPMLISDDETSKTKELSFGAEQEEVHEKNKLVYQLSKHALSHYKKPYKGDFSLAIPTNHFCYDLFLGVLPPRKRRSDLSTPSPLPIQQLESHFASNANGSQNSAMNSPSFASGAIPQTPLTESTAQGQSSQGLLSSLQISVGQVFAPPATSPFHVLLMKEQKKLKPKKLVKDVPWSGLSYDQWMLLSKNNYSVRVKVALLAETAMKNLSVKLDMITDLLVIIDSVRSNRGFVVFATTHLPALLDPALRRPGRFDETIALPLLPNIQTRFEIFKTHLSSYTECMDFLDWSLYSAQTKQNENQLSKFLTRNILLLLNSKNSKKGLDFNKTNSSFIFGDFFNDSPIYSLSQAFQSSMRLSSLWNNPNILKKILSVSLDNALPESVNKNQLSGSLLKNRAQFFKNPNFNAVKAMNQNVQNSLFTGKDKKNAIALSYAQAGQFLTEALLLKDQTTYSMKFSGNSDLQEFSTLDRQKFMFQSLYGSSFETKQTLFKLFASKISEFFVFQAFNPALSSTNWNPQILNFEKTASPEKKEAREAKLFSQGLGLQTNPSNFSSSTLQNSVNHWQMATSFLDALFQKRYLYNKNSVVTKMLFFEDNVVLGEAPSPPNSSILMPARKFENYKRTLRDFIQKPGLSINEKLQMHQKQRFLKLLYNIPVQTNFVNSKHISQNLDQKAENTSFYSSFKDLGYLDLLTLRPSSTYAFYKSRFFNRQRFSFLNQWWNGQLAEHNAETTYLSHIDWRSMFIPSISSGDIFIDFPDAEQYYNPRNRRWFLQSKQWHYWLNFEPDLRQEISEHFLTECFTKTIEMLHRNREMVDYLAYRFLRNHQLHELDLLQVLVRFYKKSEVER